MSEVTLKTDVSDRTLELAETAGRIHNVYTKVIVATPEIYVDAGETLVNIKKIRKDLDAERKGITGKIDEAKKAVMDKYRPALDQLEEAEKAISEGMNNYVKSATKEMDDQEEKGLVPANLIPQIKGITIRETWKAVVVDEDLVPGDYKIIDTSALNRIASATKGAMDVPGVEFVKTESVVGART